MPKKIDETTVVLTALFLEFAQKLDNALIVPLFDGAGKVVAAVRGVFNTGWNKVVAAVGHRYAIVPHEQVYLTALQRLEAAGFTPSRVEVFQSETRFTANIIFGNARKVRDLIAAGGAAVGDLVEFGLRFVNTYDGTTPVMGGLYAIRLKCKNGMVGPMTTILSIKRRHTTAGIADLDVAMAEFIDGSVAQIQTWLNQMSAASVAALNVQDATAVLKSVGFGKRLEKQILERLPEYQTELGETRWALVNAATHVLTHDIEASQPTLERHSAKVNRLFDEPVPVEVVAK